MPPPLRQWLSPKLLTPVGAEGDGEEEEGFGALPLDVSASGGSGRSHHANNGGLLMAQLG